MRIRNRGWALVLGAGLLAAGCDDDGGSGPGVFECSAETDGWERCSEGLVEWCHALSDPHFHAGRDCARDDLVCVVGEDHLGYCARALETCEPASTPGTCEDGAAYNCVEGLRAERRCGVGRTCQVVEGWARCEAL